VRILTVGNDQELKTVISEKLLRQNCMVDSCDSGNAALDYLQLAEYDVVLMDVNLPDGSALEVLKKMRNGNIEIPVMLLTAQAEVADIVQGLDAGADEYMVKPIHFSELMARIRVLLRKKDGVRGNIYRCGDLEINVNDQTVQRAGRQIELSPKEYSMLLYMMRNRNIVLTREQLEMNGWDYRGESASNVVDVYIRYLRKKIDEGFEQKLIHTIRGVGYALRSDD